MRFVSLLSNILWIVCCAILLIPNTVWAQQDTIGRTTDELFILARDRAAEGKYREARQLARAVLVRAPQYHDASILLARTYAWEQRYDSARVILKHVLRSAPSTVDAFDALTDVEFWSQQYEEVLALIQQALQLYPKNPGFLAKRIRALHFLGRTEEANKYYTEFARSFSTDPAFPALRDEVHPNIRANTLKVTTGTDSYVQYYAPTHSMSLAYERRTNIGPISFRLNGLRRFQTSAGQGEVEWYPRISRTSYGYVGYAYAASPLYPNHRFGIEGGMRVSEQIEAGLGGRAFLYTSRNPVWLGTMTATIYTASWYINLRPFVTVRGSRSALSGSLNVRYYLDGEENYLFARAGIGFSADDRFLRTTSGTMEAEVFFLEMQSLGTGIQHSVNDWFHVTAEAGYSRQELIFLPGRFVSVFSGTLGFGFVF
jgi:YaiO family outer membrane protein